MGCKLAYYTWCFVPPVAGRFEALQQFQMVWMAVMCQYAHLTDQQLHAVTFTQRSMWHVVSARCTGWAHLQQPYVDTIQSAARKPALSDVIMCTQNGWLQHRVDTSTHAGTQQLRLVLAASGHMY